MIRVMFVCYGNICRSPLAEFLFRDYINEKNSADKFYVSSAATSFEEIGSPVYPPVARILQRMGIRCENKRAVKLTCEDYEKYDYFIGMDDGNVSAMKRLFSGDKDGKVYKLLEFTGENRDVADPWYTRDFESAFADIYGGVKALFSFFEKSVKKG